MKSRGPRAELRSLYFNGKRKGKSKAGLGAFKVRRALSISEVPHP